MKKNMLLAGGLFEKVIIYIFVFIICYMLFSNAFSEMNNSLWLFAVAPLLITIYIWMKMRYDNRIYDQKRCNCVEKYMKKEIIFWILFSAGIMLRIMPILFNFEWILVDDQGDSAVHFFGAQQLVFLGKLSEANARYEAIFPQLYSYTLVLSVFLWILKNITFAICFSNIFFDCIAIVFLMKILNNRQYSKIYALIWWLNPIFIVMCWFPMAIVLVNAILMCSLYFGCELLNNYKTQSSKLYINAIVFGIFIFMGNLFRPMFSILLIAEAIIIALQFLKKGNKKDIGKIILTIILFLGVSLGLGKIYNNTFGQIEGYSIPKNKVGWNFFVGANYESHGAWSPDDSYYFFCELLEEVEIDVAEDILFRQGIERYKKMSLMQLGTHVIHKANLLFSDIRNCIRDLKWVFNISDSLYAFLANTTVCYYVLLLVSLVKKLIKKIREENFENSELFVMVTFIGFSMAYMLVEVMSRYITIPIAMLILVLGLYSCYGKE